MNEMKERVAKIIYERGNPMNMHEATITARAAIAAMREPMPEMCVAALSATFDDKVGDRVYCRDVPIIWKAMIDEMLKETKDEISR